MCAAVQRSGSWIEWKDSVEPRTKRRHGLIYHPNETTDGEGKSDSSVQMLIGREYRCNCRTHDFRFEGVVDIAEPRAKAQGADRLGLIDDHPNNTATTKQICSDGN